MQQGINRYTSLVLVCFCALMLSACATTRERFETYSEQVKHQPSLGVVLDLFIYRDLAGNARGYEQSEQAQLLELAEQQLRESLLELGFDARIYVSLNGLTHKFDPDFEYVNSEGWKSTGEPYQPLVLDRGDSPWQTTRFKNFWLQLNRTAREINLADDVDQTRAEQAVLDELEETEQSGYVPISKWVLEEELLALMETDIVLFVNVTGRKQHLAKYLPKALITGVLTGAATGGIAIVPSGSFAKAEAVAYQPDTQKILWHTINTEEGKEGYKGALRSSISRHPTSEGLWAWDLKRQREKEIRRKYRP